MNINIDHNMTADQAARTVRQLQAKLGEKTREATMHWEMKKSAAGELSECKQVLRETQIDLRETQYALERARKVAEEQCVRARKAEKEADKHAKQVDELRRDYEEIRIKKRELLYAFDNVWQEYLDLVEATSIEMQPEATRKRFATKE